MKIVYSNNEFKPGTMLRRMYFYDDDGDVIMTDGPVYEEIQEEEDDSDQHYDGPEDDSDQHYDGPEDDEEEEEDL